MIGRAHPEGQRADQNDAGMVAQSWQYRSDQIEGIGGIGLHGLVVNLATGRIE